MARAAVAAGHADEAIAQYKELVADTEEVAGPGRGQTIAVRASLALAYRAAGRLENSISLAEQVVTECERAFGPAQPPTTQSLHTLAGAYAGARAGQRSSHRPAPLPDRQGTDHRPDAARHDRRPAAAG